MKVLGLQWYSTSNALHFKKEYIPMEFPTQRLILFVIAKLYDPLGLLTPVVIVAQRLMQQLWFQKL